MKQTYTRIICSLLVACILAGFMLPIYGMDTGALYRENGVEITQGDVDAFGNGSLDQGRFDTIHPILAAKIPALEGKTFTDYKKLPVIMLGIGKNMIVTELKKLQDSQDRSTTANTQSVPMTSEQEKNPDASTNPALTMNNVVNALGTLFVDVPIKMTTQAMTFILKKAGIAPEQPAATEEDDDATYEDANDGSDEPILPSIDMTKIDAAIAKAKKVTNGLDRNIAQVTKKVTKAIRKAEHTINTIDSNKIKAIKEQNRIIVGGLLPATITLPDPINRTINIGPKQAFPIAIYKSDLVHGAHFATKLCVAYWVLSQLSNYRAQHIYHAMLNNTDELIALLEKTIDHQKNPPVKEKRSWKQAATDLISRKSSSKAAACQLNEHVVKHHTYIGYNPCKRDLLVPLAAYLFTNAGIAYSEHRNLCYDEDYDEASYAYTKDNQGTLQKLDADFTPIAATTVFQCLSIRGFFNTLIAKAPPSLKAMSPIPLSHKELLDTLGKHSPTHVRTAIESQTMQNIGLIAASLFEIKIMDTIYQARWHNHITTHMPYLLDLLTHYRDVRTLPVDDISHTQFEEEIMLFVQEGNTLSGLNRATLWTTIQRAALSTVSLVVISPIIAFAAWHYKKQIGQYTVLASKAAAQTAVSTSVFVLKGGAQLTVAAAHAIARNQGIRSFAQAIGRKINNGLYSIRNRF